MVGGVNPIFGVTDAFVVNANCTTTGIPQFSAPAMLVAAMGLVLVAVMKKGRLLKV